MYLIKFSKKLQMHSNLIGVGSFGSMYKGILDNDKCKVAVKVFNLLHHGATKSFIAECEALQNIRHQNLVKVLITCSGVHYQGHDFKALVYEFMTNDNLDKWLHPISRTNEVTKKQMNLNLLQRLNIAIDVAKHWNIFIIIVIHQLLIVTSSLAMFFSMMK